MNFFKIFDSAYHPLLYQITWNLELNYLHILGGKWYFLILNIHSLVYVVFISCIFIIIRDVCDFILRYFQCYSWETNVMWLLWMLLISFKFQIVAGFIEMWILNINWNSENFLNSSMNYHNLPIDYLDFQCRYLHCDIYT